MLGSDYDHVVLRFTYCYQVHTGTSMSVRFTSRLWGDLGAIPGFQALRFAYSRRIHHSQHVRQLPQTSAQRQRSPAAASLVVYKP